MSKSMKNKYYEIGVFSPFAKELLAEYVTKLPIIKNGRLVQEELCEFIRSIHGENIVILWNLKTGSIPHDNRYVIDIRLPEEPKYACNH